MNKENINEELVSVVLTTHNRAFEIVKNAIDSVVSQTYDKWELVIVDDSKKDYCDREIIKDYLMKIDGHEVKWLETKGEDGANVARNMGINVSNGKYIAFLDDDDIFLPEKHSEQIKEFKSWDNDKLGMVFCRDESKYESKYNVSYRGNCFKEMLMAARNHISGMTGPMFTKEALISVGGFDEKLRKCQDYDVFLKVARVYEISYVNGELIGTTAHDGERITLVEDGMLYKDIVVRKYKDYMISNKIYGKVLLELAQQAYEQNNASYETTYKSEASKYNFFLVIKYRIEKKIKALKSK